MEILAGYNLALKYGILFEGTASVFQPIKIILVTHTILSGKFYYAYLLLAFSVHFHRHESNFNFIQYVCKK